MSAQPTSSQVIAYLRKSRKVRHGEPVASADDQYRAILRYLADHALPPLVELPGQSPDHPGAFLDNESASKDDRADRPGWRATLAALRDGHADTLIVHAIDRASRMGLRYLLHELPPHVRLIAILDGYDSNRADIGTDVMLTIRAHEAQEYVAKLSARVTEAKHRQRSKGEYSGAPPFGFTRLRDIRGRAYGKLVHHPDQWPVVLRIFREIADGRSLRGTVAALTADGIRTGRGRKWSVTSLQNLIRNDVYAGWLTRRNQRTGYRSERVLDAHGRPIWALADGVEPVPAELIQRAREALAGHARVLPKKPQMGNRLMSRMLTCDACGGPMSWNGAGSWRCSRHVSAPGKCPNHASISDNAIQPLVVSRVLAALSALDPSEPEDAEALAAVAVAWFGETRTADAAEIAEARRAVEDVQRRAERLRRAYVDGLFEDDPAEYERQAAAVRRDRETAQRRLVELERQSAVDVTWMSEWHTLRETWDAADLGTRRAILAAALAEVRVIGHERGVDAGERVIIRMRWQDPADGADTAV